MKKADRKLALKKASELETIYSPSGLPIKPTRRPPKSPVEWDQVVSALKEAYEWGASDPEAEAYLSRTYPVVNSKKTLDILRSKVPVQCDPYKPNYIEYTVDEREEILAEFDELKNRPLLQARMNIVNSIRDGDLDISKWYLERKSKTEFSAKQDTTISAIVTPALTLEERDELLGKVFEKYKK